MWNFIPSLRRIISVPTKRKMHFFEVFVNFQIFGVHLFVKFLCFFTTCSTLLFVENNPTPGGMPTNPTRNGATDRETRGILSSFLISHGYSASNIDRWGNLMEKTTSQVCGVFFNIPGSSQWVKCLPFCIFFCRNVAHLERSRCVISIWLDLAWMCFFSYGFYHPWGSNHLLRMVVEPKNLAEEVIIPPNHHLTKWLDPQGMG